jgi:tetratricopeptide (TPR) repeat protein
MQEMRIKKAENLFSKGKMVKSLQFYESVIRKRYSVYPQELIEYQWRAKLSQNNAMAKFPKDGMHNLEDGKVVNIAISGSKEDSPEVNFSSANKLIPEENENNDLVANGQNDSQIRSEDRELLEKVVIDFNKVGMQYLSLGKIDDAKEIMKKLVSIWREFANQDLKLVWLTFNNVSWIHKKLGELKMALKLLKRAQLIAEDGWAHEYLALTYINLSAIYSELKK